MRLDFESTKTLSTNRSQLLGGCSLQRFSVECLAWHFRGIHGQSIGEDYERLEGTVGLTERASIPVAFLLSLSFVISRDLVSIILPQ